PGGVQGFNMARVVSVLSGMDTVPGTTVNRYCSSSLQTTRMAMHAIKAGEGDVFISAGVETVSNFANGVSDHIPDAHQPQFADACTDARAAGGAPAWTAPREDGLLPDVYIPMGPTAENVAQMTGITREDQDHWGVRSQNRAVDAVERGNLDHEITPVTMPDGT